MEEHERMDILGDRRVERLVRKKEGMIDLI